MVTIKLIDHRGGMRTRWGVQRWRAYYHGSLWAGSLFLGRRELLVVLGYWWRAR